MLRAVAAQAKKLDDWLQERLGRPYNTVLLVGILAEVVHRAMDLPKHAIELHSIGAIAALTLVDLALLIHQVGALSHHFERRDHRRRAAEEAEGASGLPRRRRRA